MEQLKVGETDSKIRLRKNHELALVPYDPSVGSAIIGLDRNTASKSTQAEYEEIQPEETASGPKVVLQCDFNRIALLLFKPHTMTIITFYNHNSPWSNSNLVEKDEEYKVDLDSLRHRLYRRVAIRPIERPRPMQKTAPILPKPDTSKTPEPEKEIDWSFGDPATCAAIDREVALVRLYLYTQKPQRDPKHVETLRERAFRKNYEWLNTLKDNLF